jgi:hypothetical protein
MIFDQATLRRLAAEREVDIETVRPDGTPRRTVIWIMVDGQDVFVRSWRGDRGYWYQSATEPNAQVALWLDGRRIPVRFIDATDAQSVARASRQLELKYAGNDSLPGMLRPSVLGTTLRLEPMEADTDTSPSTSVTAGDA